MRSLYNCSPKSPEAQIPFINGQHADRNPISRNKTCNIEAPGLPRCIRCFRNTPAAVPSRTGINETVRTGPTKTTWYNASYPITTESSERKSFHHKSLGSELVTYHHQRGIDKHIRSFLALIQHDTLNDKEKSKVKKEKEGKGRKNAIDQIYPKWPKAVKMFNRHAIPIVKRKS